MPGATDLNAYLEQIVREIETKAEKYHGKDLGYLLGLRAAAQVVLNRMIVMGDDQRDVFTSESPVGAIDLTDAEFDAFIEVLT